jgi:AraC-like DNA-binding protein
MMPQQAAEFKNLRVPFLTGVSKSEPLRPCVNGDHVPFTTRLTVRNAWLSEINRRAQEFTGRFVPGEDLPNAVAIEAFVRTLPRPANAAEQTLLKAALLDLALRWNVYAHARYHGKHRCSCVFAGLETLPRMWRVDPRWDDEVASEWAGACACIGERLRAREDARRLGTVLLEAIRTPGRSAACDVRSMTWTLRRTFQDEFGCTPHEFLTRRRIARAIPLLAKGMKTGIVASEVGYRSKKDLFGALKRLTGLLPSEVQKLSASQLASVVAGLDPTAN